MVSGRSRWRRGAGSGSPLFKKQTTSACGECGDLFLLPLWLKTRQKRTEICDLKVACEFLILKRFEDCAEEKRKGKRHKRSSYKPRRWYTLLAGNQQITSTLIIQTFSPHLTRKIKMSLESYSALDESSLRALVSRWMTTMMMMMMLWLWAEVILDHIGVTGTCQLKRLFHTAVLSLSLAPLFLICIFSVAYTP